ncbi:MAG TPA: AAA family ATPase [Cytophagaceae bacterium]
MEKTDDLLALIYESFNGETLYNFYKDRTPSIKEFLTVAISISESLAKLHENGIIHKNINPSSILIEKDTHAIKITDFGIATLMPLEYFQTLPNPVIIEGSLPFISPEQTGRMNRTLDYRTDIYSLGVTFYFILTGQLPFTANDPLEWVYNHMIRIPKAPEQLNPSIPTTVSNIIMKMMAKQADDRYQSLNGLTYDLKKCLTLLDDTGFITDFQPGKNDYTGKLQISQKIFGREKEIALLLESYNNVVNTGTAHLLLVSGYSGIGKSALIKELNKPITRQKGLFVSGKFDQFKKTVPYSTIVEAFSSLVLNILGEPEIQLNKWRNTLLEALGENGQIIIDVIPQLERIIGKQPTVPKLPLLETQNRFIIVFEKFIQVFSKLEHPLTLFLDDLHWADHASLALIKQIISNPSNKYIYIVGAFRENEVLPSHPLRIFINDLENSRKAPFSQLKLSALSKENVTQLIADSLKAEVEYVKPLADLVYDKTNGNPFFTIQFLQMLHQEKLLTFEQQQWKWDINNIKAKEYTSNVVELMVLKIRHISSESQHILTHAAYIGNNISRKILSLVTEIPEELIHSKMEEPIREGLIYSYGHNYKFLHDRVQEAAYSLTPENQAPLIHLKIGRTLLTSLSKQEVEHHLFDIANHLNSANQYIDATEKNLLFRLNYLAAQKARSSIAYEAARSYLFHASSLLPKDALDSRYTDAFPVYLDLAECEYLVGNFTSAEVLYNLLLNKAGSRQDRVNVYIMRSRLYQAAGRYTDAVKVTREALSLFGVEFPDNRDELQKEFESEYSKIPTYLGGRTIHDLLDAPEVDDPDIASVISILAESLPTWYSGRPDLFPLLVIKALNICLQHGNISEASRIYSGYAMVLIAGFRDIPSGYAYSELSLLINDKYKDKKFQGLLLFVHAVYVNIWQKHIIKSDRMLDDGLNICVEAGDLAFAGYAAILKVVHEIEKGEPLNKVRQECKNKISFAIQIHNTAVETSVRGSEQFIKCLQGKTNAYGNFDDTTYSESSAIEVFKNSGLGSALAIYLIQRQTACLFFDLPEKALEYAQQVEPFQQEVAAMIVEADFHFIHALTLASLFHKEKPQQPGHYIKSITQALQLMNLWADNCPENFKHRCLLLSAELASIENKDLEAIRLYDEAILQAKNNGFVQWEALYSEFAGKFFLRKELPFIAESYLRKAYECYSKWEATGKTKQMTELYPFLKTKSSLAITESGIPVEQLDLLSITKASQTISSYINLEQLVGNLLKIGIQQAVAEKAYLFLLKDGQMLPVAEASNIEDSINVKVYNTTDVLPNTGYSQSVIQYVSRTQEKIIIDNGSSSNIFGNDEYIASTHPKSIACLPIVKQSKLTGIIYLENNLFAGAFSEDKIITLELLISQAAISIENAVLFTELTNSKQLLQDIINNSSAAIFLKDLEGKYIFVNNEYEKIFNLPKEE